jgi:hypothetical protein
VLEKWIWSNSDYESMSWHDNFVHAISYDPEKYSFELDIDHICEWIDPRNENGNFSFALAPATLIFENASDLDIDIKIGSVVDFSIYEIKRENVENKFRPDIPIFKFTIVMDHLGKIELHATDYKMYVRKKPIESDALWFTKEERGGISLEREIPEQLGTPTN